MLEAFEKLFDLVEWHGDIAIQTRMERFKGKRKNSPQVFVYQEPNKMVSIEISGNEDLNPQLSEEEYGLMSLLGWNEPIKAKDEDYGNFPNFSREFSPGTSLTQIAEATVYALVTVYGMKKTDLIELDGLRQADWLDDWKILHRLEIDPQNDERTLFRLPKVKP